MSRTHVSVMTICFTILHINACASSDADGGGEGTVTNNLTFAASCEAPAACGGDLVGTWRLVTRCETFSEDTLASACFTGIDSFRGSENDTLQVHESHAIGYRWEREHTQSFNGKYPSGCHSTEADCDAFINDFEYEGERLVRKGSCEFSSGDALCDCDLHETQFDDEYGVYDLNAGAITLTPAGGGSHDPLEATYCVEGEQLTLAALDGSFVSHFKRTSNTTTF